MFLVPLVGSAAAFSCSPHGALLPICVFLHVPYRTFALICIVAPLLTLLNLSGLARSQDSPFPGRH